MIARSTLWRFLYIHTRHRQSYAVPDILRKLLWKCHQTYRRKQCIFKLYYTYRLFFCIQFVTLRKSVLLQLSLSLCLVCWLKVKHSLTFQFQLSFALSIENKWKYHWHVKIFNCCKPLYEHMQYRRRYYRTLTPTNRYMAKYHPNVLIK